MTVSQLLSEAKMTFGHKFCIPAQFYLSSQMTVGQFYALDIACFSGYNNYDNRNGDDDIPHKG
jgi:hypothetical protein